MTLPHLAMPEVYFSSGPASMPQEMGPRLKISFIMAACATCPEILHGSEEMESIAICSESRSWIEVI